MEEVVRIVSALDILETPVIGSIRRRGWVARLVIAEIVGIAARTEEPAYRGIGFARPLRASIRDRRVHPLGQNDEVVTLEAMRKGGVADRYAAHGAMEMLEQKLAHRRRAFGEAV